MKAILTNYNFDPTEMLKNFDDFLIYDRSDDGKDWCKDLPKDKVIRRPNIGHVEYDKLGYLVDYYDTLPEVFVWGKTNMLERHITKEEFEAVKTSKVFTPLLTQNHRTYGDRRGPVCYYKDGMYYERNDCFYLLENPAKHFRDYAQYASYFHLPNPQFIPFAPGGCYILTKEAVHKYSRDIYAEMRSFMDYTVKPGEAYLAERSYHLLWS